MNINKIICTGRLTKDPELRKISEDMSVCQLRLAVDGMGRSREVGFINVSVFGKAGEACAEYLAKGWLVAVDGRLEYGEWDSEGTKRHDYNVVGNVEFLTAPVRPRRRRRSRPSPPAASASRSRRSCQVARTPGCGPPAARYGVDSRGSGAASGVSNENCAAGRRWLKTSANSQGTAGQNGAGTFATPTG